MHYYEIEFNPVDYLVDTFGVYEDDNKRVCAQTYCVQSDNEISTIDDMISFLKETQSDWISGTNMYDLINFVDPFTADQVYDFWEITPEEFYNTTGK